MESSLPHLSFLRQSFFDLFGGKTMPSKLQHFMERDQLLEAKKNETGAFFVEFYYIISCFVFVPYVLTLKIIDSLALLSNLR